MPTYSHSPLITPRRPSTPPTPRRSLISPSSTSQTHQPDGQGVFSTTPVWGSSSAMFGSGLFSGVPANQPASVQWGSTPSLLPASVQWGSNTSFGGSSYASSSTSGGQDPFAPLAPLTPQSAVAPPPDRHRKSESKRKRFEDEDGDEVMGGDVHRASPARERDGEMRALAGRSLVPKRIRAGLGSVAIAVDDPSHTASPTPSSATSARINEAGSTSRSGDATPTHDASTHLDLGKMLASLDKSHLLTMLSSLLTMHPQLASTIHGLIPTPTLESVHQSLDAYESSIKQALPFGHGAIRPEYAWNRLKGPVADMVADIQGWMEFFRAKQQGASEQHEGVHPNTMFSLLLSITARMVKIQRDYLPPVPALAGVSSRLGGDASYRATSGTGAAMLASLPPSAASPHSPNVLLTMLLPQLLGAWDALLQRVSHDVNGLGKMFGREVVAGWLRGLEQLLAECDIESRCVAEEAPASASGAVGRNDDAATDSTRREPGETLRAVQASVRGLSDGFKREIGWVVGSF
ncbi:unnamed protein product [Parajaminaea phylloscopi]